MITARVVGQASDLRTAVSGGGYKPGERGVALVVVIFVLIVVLMGGLAGVALTSAELSGTYGFRSRQVTESCAQAAIDKIRAGLPSLTVGGVADSFALPNGCTVSIRAGHVDGLHGMASTDSPLLDVPAGSYDAASLNSGENITNAMGTAGGGKRLVSAIATCTGLGNSKQEIELVFRYGVAVGQ